MARVKFGSIVTGLAGKIGGHVYQVLGSGGIVRTNARPRQSIVSISVTARNNLASIARSWQSLTVAQRTSWSTYASTYPFTNRWGTAFTGTPYQCFVFENGLRQLAGLALNLSSNGYAAITGVSVSMSNYTVATDTCTITPGTTLPINQVLLISCTYDFKTGNTGSGLTYNRCYLYSYPTTGALNIGAYVKPFLKHLPSTAYSVKIKVQQIQTAGVFGKAAAQWFIVNCV